MPRYRKCTSSCQTNSPHDTCLKMTEIKTRLQTLQKEIAHAALSKGRDPKEIKLIAVSKGQSLEKIKEAIDCGLTSFGENYVQEFLEKWKVLDHKASWIFIGHLQTNKVKYIIDKVSEIHSVDSLKLFQTIQKEAQKARKKIPLLIEINIGGEKTKSGIPFHDVFAFFKEILRAYGSQDDRRFSQNDMGIPIHGLMAIPPYFDDSEKGRPYFQKLRTLKEELNQKFPNLNLTELSMGMTHDFKIAIEEGATHIRVGEGIFGKRRETR